VFIGLTVWLWYSPPQSLPFLLGWLVLIYFGVVVVIDIEHRLILHPVSWVGAVLGLVVGTWTRADFYASSHLPTGKLIFGFGADAWLNGCINALLGGVVGFGIMWFLYTFGEWFLRLLARRRGLPADEVALGFGDVNLSGIVGLMLGWPVVILGLFTAVLIGGLVSLLYMLVMLAIRRYHILTALPYGPYLVAGAILMLYFPRIVSDILK
jgi:leader peptidase (prepilin peptidase)/N-methyltransferase